MTTPTEISQEIRLLKKVLDEGGILLDVRTHCEYCGYHLEGAVNIPCEDIELMMAMIKEWKKPVVVYGASDRRSEIATGKLKGAGIEAYDCKSIWELEKWFSREQ